ncbi:MAG: hypothetical protein ACTHNU_00260 [Gaiellales bacterium]
MSRLRLPALVILAALTVSGCSGNSANPGSSKPSVTPAQALHRYLTAMFATHKRTNPFPTQTKDDLVLSAIHNAPDSTWPPAAKAAHREAVDAQREAKAFAAIAAPEGLHKAHQQYIAGLHAEIAAFTSLQRSIAARNVSKTNAAFTREGTAGGPQLSAWRVAVLAACKRLHVTPPTWVKDVGV